MRPSCFSILGPFQCKHTRYSMPDVLKSMRKKEVIFLSLNRYKQTFQYYAYVTATSISHHVCIHHIWSHPTAYSICMWHKHSRIMCCFLCTLEETVTNCEHSWKCSGISGMSKVFCMNHNWWLISGQECFSHVNFEKWVLKYYGTCLEWLLKTCPSWTLMLRIICDKELKSYVLTVTTGWWQWGLRVEWLRFSYQFMWAWIFKTLQVLKVWIQIACRKVSSTRCRLEGWSSKKFSLPHPHSISSSLCSWMLNWLFTSPCCAMLKKIVLYRLGIALLFLFSVSTSRSLTSYSFHQQHKEFYIGCHM